MKRNQFLLLLCVAAIAGILYTVVLKKGHKKSEIFNYVQENQVDLEQFVADLMKGDRKDAAYGNWQVAYYAEASAVEFQTNSFGLGSSTTYEGFYYSENDRLIGFQGVELEFLQDGDGWIWQETSGDNCDRTERIMAHWYWFKMSF